MVAIAAVVLLRGAAALVTRVSTTPAPRRPRASETRSSRLVDDGLVLARPTAHTNRADAAQVPESHGVVIIDYRYADQLA